MADAFISYSRKEKAFAIALKERLEAVGFEILFDLEDILGSEDWARRLADMIAAADHFVFVISPDSCQSRVCSVEINTAVELSKSIFFLEGLDENWNVGIFDLYGDPAPFERIATGDGLVLSFRPRKDLYIDGQVGDYFLAFQLGEKGKPGVPLKVKMRLKVSDKHFTTTSDGTR